MSGDLNVKIKNILNEIYISENKKKYTVRLASLSLCENILNEDIDPRTQQIISLIDNNRFEVNNYESFLNSLNSGKRGGFLSKYDIKELIDSGIKTYKLKNYNIGFAIKPDGDIISVHNNSGIKGIGDALIQSAIRFGGTKLDHFDGYLSDFYSKHGFKETDRYKWDDQYRPDDWNENKYGKPDVVYRSL